jgi:hypothetical protein
MQLSEPERAIPAFDEESIQRMEPTSSRAPVWNANEFVDGIEPTTCSFEELSGTDDLGNQLQSISVHDQVMDLAEKLNSLPELSTEWVAPSRALIERFLDLQRPRLDTKMLECFRMDGK